MFFFKLILTFLFCSNFLFSAYLKNIPVELIQPDGSKINCLTSGDEFYNYLHDKNDFTIIQSNDDGYYYYAVKSNNNLIPSFYRVNSVNPQDVGLDSGQRISLSEYKLKKQVYLENVEYTSK